MTNVELNEKLERYAQLKAQSESLKEEMDDLNQEIKDMILAHPEYENRYVNDKYNALVVEKRNFTYDAAVLTYLKKNKMHNYIKESVDTTKLNKDIKANSILNESVRQYYTETVSHSLTVKSN